MKRIATLFVVFLILSGICIGADFQWSHFAFTGKWQPALDPIQIDANGFQDIQNLRTSYKGLRGVGGHTVINSSVWNATNLYPVNGFHFKKDQPAESHVIVYTTDTAGDNGKLYQNTTAIPSAGSFSATALHTDAAGAGVGRFSKAPGGNMLYTNGAESMVWGGDEAPITLLYTDTTDAPNGQVYPKDYTDEVTENSTDKVAVIGGGIDANTKLMLHADGTDGGTTFTDESGTHTPGVDGTDANTDADQKKFGPTSILFAGDDRLVIADHADFNWSTSKLVFDVQVRFPSATGQHCLYSQATGTDYVTLWQNQDADKIIFTVMSGGTRLVYETATWNPSINTWYHVALIRGWGGGANDWAITVDGAAIGTFTASITIPDLAASAYIGSMTTGVIIDEGNTGHAITVAGGGVINSTSKWGDGSLYYDGGDDIYYAPTHADFDLVGSNSDNWTAHFYVKHADHAGTEGYLSHYEDAGNFWTLSHIDGTGIQFSFYSGAADKLTISGGEITDTDWHHVALCKVANEYGVYKDGTIVAYGTTNDTDTFTGNMVFGGETSALNFISGNIDEIAIVQSNVFTAAPDVGLSDTITVPTAAGTSDSNTKILIHGDELSVNGHIDEVHLSTGAARHTSNFTAPTRAYSVTARYWLVGSQRPLQGVKFYISDANVAASTMTVKEWQGGSWVTLSATDNTDTGASLAQTGTVTWTKTGLAEVKYIQGLSLYWYQFSIDDGDATIYYVTADAPFQTVKNIWDASKDDIGQFKKYDTTTYTDYTDEVQSTATTDVAILDSLNTTHSVYLGFTGPMQGFDVKLAAGKENATGSVLTVSMWDGTAWATLGSLSDGTAEGGATLGKSGVVSFQPRQDEEFVTSLTGETPLYYYKLTVSVQLDAEVEVYSVTGIPATETIGGYKFPGFFQGRAWLFSETAGAKNMARYSAYNQVDTWNGADSDVIYFGDETELKAAASLYNVFQTTGYEQLIVTKSNKTYRLETADDPLFKQFTMSKTIGCTAPLSMAVCDATDIAEGQKRQVVIWQSESGVVMCDGATIVTISGDIANYWDANSDDYIPTDRQDDSVGWYDPKLQAYKLLISSGSGQSTHNVELEYSLKYQNWTKLYRENGSGANPLQCGFTVEDTDGSVYSFGGTNEGKLYYTENSVTWNGTAIEQYVQTKDLLLDPKAPLLRQTEINHVRLLYTDKTTADTEDISWTHWCDQSQTTDGSEGQEMPGDIDMANGPYETHSTTLGRCLTHSFKLAADISTVADGMELTGLGFFFESFDDIED